MLMDDLKDLQTKTGERLVTPALGDADIVQYLSEFLHISPNSEQERVDRAIEGLAFATIGGHVKEKLVSDPYAGKLVEVGKLASVPVYGYLMILVNLTNYKKQRNAEEKQVDQLLQFAKQRLPERNDPLDENESVSLRVSKLVEVGIVEVLSQLAAKLSKAQSIIANLDRREELDVKGQSFSVRVCHLLTTVFLNLATVQKLHGQLLAQGVAKALLILLKLTPLKGDQMDSSEEGRLLEDKNKTATQALAKLCATHNPLIAFPQERYISLIAPIFQYLLPDSHELLQFEGLLALTNIASLEGHAGYASRAKILTQRQGVGAIENLVFSDNLMVRRAAVEAICNLLQDEQVFQRYSTLGLPSKIDAPFVADDSCKLKLLIAFADDPNSDYDLYRAATGALAILSSNKTVARALAYGSSQFYNDKLGDDVRHRQWAPVVLSLLTNDNPEILHRGLECLENICGALGSPSVVEQVLPNCKATLQRTLLVLKRAPQDPYVSSLEKQAQSMLSQL